MSDPYLELSKKVGELRESQALVDRLARALAAIPPSLMPTQGEAVPGWRLACCNVRAHPQAHLRDPRAHAFDCVYVWSVDHVIALEDK